MSRQICTDLASYEKIVFEDAKDAIEDSGIINTFKKNHELDSSDFSDYMYDNIAPSITGDIDGSYFCSRYAAEESLKGIIFDEDFLSSLTSYCLDNDFWSNIVNGYDPEAADVIARYVVLYNIAGDIQDWFEEQIGRELD